MGAHNEAKDSIPVLAVRLMTGAGEQVRLEMRPLEQDPGFGLGVLAFLNATAVEGFGPTGPLPTAGDYCAATQALLRTGLWVNKSDPSNLATKLGKYKGGTSTYPSNNHKKVSWFVPTAAEAQPVPSTRPGNFFITS